MKLHRLAVVLLPLLVLSSAAASRDLTLDRGVRVRITAPDLDHSRLIGEVERVDRDTLVINIEASQIAVPMASVNRIEISRGIKSNTLRGVLYGGLAGGLVGGTATAASNDSESLFYGMDIFIGTAIGMVIGAGSGALIGWGVQTEHWEEQPLPLSLAFAPLGGGDYALGVILKFPIPIGP
jgi:hypothetical protein